MINDLAIQETVLVLQNTMLDMLRRRAVIQGLEVRAMNKILDSTVLNIIASDYLRAQLSDLRKFFDKDTRVHQIAKLTAVISDTATKVHHDSLYTIWKSTYEDAANKYLLHLEVGYVPPPDFSRAALDSFIDEMNQFLDEVISGLTVDNYAVAHNGGRHISSGYIPDLKSDAENFFTLL
jgi:hypothetical protein